MSAGSKKESILLVDPLAGDRGHLLDDDQFLAECLSPLADNFLVATSPASSANLAKGLQVATYSLRSNANSTRFARSRLLRAMLELPCQHYNDIVFQSFEEVSTLLFMLLHPRKQVHLIATNNLRPDRLRRHPLLGRWFLRQVFHRATSVIVHSRHEVERVLELDANLDPKKIFVKPFHKFAQNKGRELESKKQPPTILYLGPEQPHKSIKPLLELIQRDQQQRFQYQFCAMGKVPDNLEEIARQKSNVEILRDYISEDCYYQLFRESSLVVMTHDEKYEGVLSGALCDAVACGTPVVSRPIAPVTEFFADFGPMGYLVDMRKSGWTDNILKAELTNDLKLFSENMAKLRKSCEMPAIRNVFAQILGAGIGRSDRRAA